MTRAVSVCFSFVFWWGAALTQNTPGLCHAWGNAHEIGELDVRLIDEASGLAASSRFPGRFYHIDDSALTIYITDSAGVILGSIAVSGATGMDVEDLALGPCNEGTCLFIADIGDNDGVRQTVDVFLVEEVQEFPARVLPRHRIRLRYPDGPQNAEALAVHPNGDIFLMSRKLIPRQSEAHAELFRLPSSRWQDGTGGVETLEHVASVDLRELAPTLPGRLVTGMDFSEDGERMLILTYVDAFEFRVDAGAPSLGLDAPFIAGDDYTRIPLARLQQQEAVAYLPGSNGFVYGTEAGLGRSPIMSVRCRDR